jgi:hypothetical protein
MSKTLTKKDLAKRWNCCFKTVERRVRSLQLIPVSFTGNQPLWDEAALEKAESNEKLRRLEMFKKRFITEKKP